MTIYSPKKKVMSLLLAVLMLLSTAAPAFADVFAFVTVEEEKAPVYGSGVLTAELDGYTVTVGYGEDAQIPEGAELFLYEYVEGTLQYDEYKAAAEASVLGEDEETVFARFFDITISYTDPATGETVKVEPAAPVDVEIQSAQLTEAEKVSVVHFPEAATESSDEAEGLVEEAIGEKTLKANKGALKAGLTANADLTVEGDAPVADLPVENNVETPAMEVLETETVGEGVVAFTADGFSVYGIVGTTLVTTFTLPGRDEIYEVEVTYGRDAKIPEDVRLVVRAYDEGSGEYLAAKDIVSEAFYGPESYFDDDRGFAALDISIVDKEGNIIEPADGAEVTVSLKLAELPEGISEEEFLDTFEINHICDYNGIIEVEPVEFLKELQIIDGVLETEFTVGGFSTFTIIWGNATTNSTNLRLRQTTNNTVGQVTCYYVNGSGYNITRPTDIGNNFNINNVGQWPNNYEVVISSDNVARAISGRTYEKAYIVVNGTQHEVTRILFSRTANNSFKYDYYNGNTLVTSVSGGNVTNNSWMIPVYLQYSGDANKVTLHFVDHDGNPISGVTYNGATLTDEVSFMMTELFPNSGDTLDFTTAFSKEGYTFSNSYLHYYKGAGGDTGGYGSTNGVPIGNQLNRNNNTIRYRTRQGNNDYTEITDGNDIYLVYSPVGVTGSSGSGSGSGGSDTPPDLGEIGNSKAVNPNGDGTYDVALTVSGIAQRKSEETDINVVFIIDCSNSMVNNNVTRLRDTKIAVNAMADELLKNNTSSNPDAVQLALTQFNNTSATIALGDSNWTTNYATFENAVNTLLTTHQGTNWEAGLQEALSVSGDGDPTYYIFFTDGQPTNFVGWQRTGTDYYNSYYEWDYWPARDEARRIINNGNILYCIYAYGTDDQYLRNLTKYAYNNDSADDTYYYLAQDSTAVDSALKAILKQINMNFAYANVGIDDGVTGLSSTTLTGVDTSSLTYTIKYRDYTSTTEYTIETVEFTRNSDGTLTIPAVTYHVLDKNANNETIVKEITTEEVTITGVTFTDNGTTTGKTVSWDMDKVPVAPDTSTVYMLEDGWTYGINFTIWPSQEAYDIVAALNNNIINWGEDYTYTKADGTPGTVEFDTYKDQILRNGDRYSLMTNTDCIVTYQQVTATTDSNGNVTYVYGDEKEVHVVANPEGKMGLESTYMNVEKAWDDTINTRNRANYVDFYLKVDGKYYHKDGTESEALPSDSDAYIIVVTDTGYYVEGGTVKSAGGTAWIDSVYIAPGVMTTEGGIEVLENGHYYTIIEKSAHKFERDSNRNPIVGSEDSYQSYTMDFTTQTVRPMVVDGTLEYLVLVDDDNPVPSGAKTYTIGSETYYVESGSTAALTATNHKTPEFDITKAIDDGAYDKAEAELNEEIFTYTVKVTVPEGTTDIEKNGVGYWIYEPSTSSSAWTLPEYAAEGAEYAPYGYTEDATYYGDSRQAVSFNGDTATVTIQIHRTDIIRFVNLPVGTTYTIVETPTEYYSVSSATTGGSASEATINGTISNVNTRYYNQYTNTVIKDFVYAELDVKKAVSGFDWLEDDEYTFTLAPVEEAPMPMVREGSTFTEATSVTVTASYDSSTQGSTIEIFGSIRFTEAGSYQYTITETEGSLEYIDYADPVSVTVTVEEVNGSLKITNITDSAGTTVYTAATSSSMANGLTTMTNKVTPTDISATKEWLDAIGNVMTTIPEGANVTFTLYQDGNATEQTVVLDGTVDETGEDPAWTATFKDLPMYTVTVSEGVRTATKITYTIGETTPYEGFKLITTDPVGNNGTIQNKQQAIPVSMIKIDASSGNKALADAEFKLYSDADLSTQITVDANGQPIGVSGIIKTDSEGKANIGTLAVGTYYLVETKAPAGYNMLTSPITINVEATTTTPYVRVTYNQVDYAASQSTGLLTNLGEDGETIIGYTITVDNKSGAVLPSTGASHPLAFTIAGLAMVGAVGAVLHHRKKEEES